jgi:hypothetical protein
MTPEQLRAIARVLNAPTEDQIPESEAVLAEWQCMPYRRPWVHEAAKLAADPARWADYEGFVAWFRGLELPDELDEIRDHVFESEFAKSQLYQLLFNLCEWCAYQPPAEPARGAK